MDTIDYGRQLAKEFERLNVRLEDCIWAMRMETDSLREDTFHTGRKPSYQKATEQAYKNVRNWLADGAEYAVPPDYTCLAQFVRSHRQACVWAVLMAKARESRGIGVPGMKPSKLPPCVRCGAEWLPGHECAPVTEVVFRVWPKSEGGDVFALFPYDYFDAAATLCSSYQHVGGHGAADYSGRIQRTRPAKPEEYARLKRELESEPYNYRLKVVQRRGRR